MRVLHVVPAIAPRYGGPSVAVLGMCRALRSAGVDTVVATTDADGPDRLPVSRETFDLRDGVPVRVFRHHLGDAFKWSPSLSRWLASHVGEFDVVHVHAVFSHSSVAAGRACRRMGVPFILRPLGTLDPWSLLHHRRRKQALLSLGLRRTLAHAAAVHYTSDDEMRRSLTALPWLPSGVVVPLGVASEFFSQLMSTPASPPYVLALSRLDAKKGIDLLIQAFHDLAGDRKLASWRLVIAGGGDAGYVRHLRQLAASGDAANRIAFSGWVDGPARRTLVEQASLFALASHQENFGVALVEALACGVPAIVSPGVNLGAPIEAAGAGWRVDRTRAAFGAALRLAMVNDAVRRWCSERAKQFADQFRWSAVVPQLQSLYDTVAAGTARQARPSLSRSDQPLTTTH